MTWRINSLALVTLFLLTATHNAHSIDVDRTQPIEIESDSAVIDDSQGFSTYRGNVIIRQGSTTLTADNISVFARERAVTQIIANGTPATFKQTDASSNIQNTSGQAEQITYKAKDAVLIFNGNATLAQDTNSFSGNRIEYDIMDKAIRAKGDQDSGKRVKIQYFPQASEPSSENSDSQTNDNLDQAIPNEDTSS
jgi:lipopolysaccharide export system protein LptA